MTVPKSGRDARQHPRAPIELKVDYRKLNSFFADYTKNISMGGTFIRTQRALPVGTQFLFHLTIPAEAGPFEIAGEVVWSRNDGEEPGMGIRFIYRDDAQREAFHGIVERLMAESLGSQITGKLLNKSVAVP